VSTDDWTDVKDNSEGLGELMGSTNDLADEEPRSRIDRILQWVPRILSSKPHVILLIGLGIYLIVLPILGVKVSSSNELIGGNYTNVTSDIGACIAAGGTLHLISQGRKRRRIEEERLMLARQTHRLLRHVYFDAARQLGHVGHRPPGGLPGGPPLGGDDEAGWDEPEGPDTGMM
jgi:hypothetical protein